MFGIGLDIFIACLLVFITGRVDLAGYPGPFGEALYIAALRVYPDRFAMLVLVLTLGGMSGGGWVMALSNLVFALIYWVLDGNVYKAPMIAAGRETVPLWRMNFITYGWVPAVSAVGSSLVYILSTGKGIPAPASLLPAMLESLLVVLLYPVFLRAIRHIREIINSSPRDGRTVSIIRPSETVVFALLLAAVTAGLTELSLGPLRVQHAVVIGAVTFIGWAKGAGVGAVSGVITGAVSSMVGRDALSAIGMYALVGGMAGLFAFWGRKGAVAGAFLAVALAFLSNNNFQNGLVFDYWLGPLTGLILAAATPAGVVLDRLGIKRGVDSLEEQAPPEEQQERLVLLAGVLNDLASVCNEAAATDSVSFPEEELAQMINRVSVNVCSHCQSYANCWGKGFRERYRKLVGVLAAAETGDPRGSPALKEWAEGCYRTDEIALSSMFLMELREIDRKWRSRMEDSRSSLSGHLKGLADLLEDTLSGEDKRVSKHMFTRFTNAPLRYSIEVVKVARDGRLVCGDSHLVRELSGNRLLLMISDGMGNGDRAARESRAAVSYVERLIAAGFDVKTAIRMVNSMLLMRSPEEIFATLDLMLVDLMNGEAEVLKVGAAPSFLYHDGDVTVVRVDSLPLGILDTIDLNLTRLNVNPGDVVVMASDGLFEPQGEALEMVTAIAKTVCGLATAKEGGIAQALLESVSPGGTGSDDITVLVVRFDKTLEG